MSGNLGTVTERYHRILRVLKWFENSEVFGDLAHVLTRHTDMRCNQMVLVLPISCLLEATGRYHFAKKKEEAVCSVAHAAVRLETLVVCK